MSYLTSRPGLVASWCSWRFGRNRPHRSASEVAASCKDALEGLSRRLIPPQSDRAAAVVDDLFFVIDGIRLCLLLDEIEDRVPSRVAGIDDDQFIRVGLTVVVRQHHDVIDDHARCALGVELLDESQRAGGAAETIRRER